MHSFITIKRDSRRRATGRRMGCLSICALLLSLALGVAERAFAVPAMALDSVVVAPGQSADLVLRLTSASAPYGGFNASFYLPPNVSVVAVEPGPILPAGCVPYVHEFTVDGTRGVSIVAFSATGTFSTDGELCRVTLQVAETAPPGDYPVGFGPARVPAAVNGSHALGSSDGAASVAHTAADGVFTIRLQGHPGDLNGNGIPDSWEILHFGDVTNVSHSTDYDGDGLSDYYEYRAGTDPLNPQSCIAIHTASMGAAGFELRWYSIPGALYSVERGGGSEGWIEFMPVREDIPATPPLNIYTDSAPSSASSAFFRILRQP